MRIKAIANTVYTVWRRIQSDLLGLYAAQASFFLIISFVPLLMLFLTLVQFILPVDEASLIEALEFYLPEGIQSFVTGIVQELFSKQTMSIISVSTLVLLWAASRGVHSVILGLRHIFRVPKAIYYKERLRSLLYTVALLLTILFELVVLVFGNTLWSLLENAFPLLHAAGPLVTLTKYVLSALLITLFALLLYCATAEKPLTSFRVQLPGAIFTAAGWILFSTGFSLYITNFANYSYIYGSLTALILFMLWIYTCMWVLFLGAELNRILYQRRLSRLQMMLKVDED